MSSSAELQLAYRYGNAPVFGFPYPHSFIRDVFPKDFYDEMRRNLPDPAAMIPIEQARAVKGYKERFVLGLNPQHLEKLPADKRKFWQDFGGWLLSGRFSQLGMSKYRNLIEQRFKGQSGFEFYHEALLVEDVTNYKLGPHTDATRKVVTLLFYLPKDESQAHLGTSIYVPKDLSFTCPGGPHHPFEQFDRVVTMPFLPNSMFTFVKTDNSFHGVEPVNDPDTRRWLLLFDIYVRPTQSQPQFTPAPAGETKFSF